MKLRGRKDLYLIVFIKTLRLSVSEYEKKKIYCVKNKGTEIVENKIQNLTL